MTQPIEPFLLPLPNGTEEPWDYIARLGIAVEKHFKQSPQPAQEVDPIRELLAKAYEAADLGYSGQAIRDGKWPTLVEALRTGIADLVKPVEDVDVPWSYGIRGFAIAERLRSHGLRIIKEPGL